MLGTKVRELRKSRGLTIAELASNLGISESYLSQLESEKVDPSISLVRKLAAEFQVSIAVFFDTEYEKPIVTRMEERAATSINGGDIILTNIAPSADSVVLSMKEITMKPASVITHTSDTYHTSLYVTEGTATVRYADTEAVIYAGDSIFLPADISLEISNESEDILKGLLCTKVVNGGME